MTQFLPRTKSFNTKERILEIASQLFSENSYLGVSMEDIAKKVRTTKAALYYHFTGKYEIYEEVLSKAFDNLIKRLSTAIEKQTTVQLKLQNFVESYLEFGQKEKNLIKALTISFPKMKSKLQTQTINSRKKIVRAIKPLIKEIVPKKQKEKHDIDLLSSLLISMLDGLLLEYSLLNKKINPEKIAKQINSILFKPTGR